MRLYVMVFLPQRTLTFKKSLVVSIFKKKKGGLEKLSFKLQTFLAKGKRKKKVLHHQGATINK